MQESSRTAAGKSLPIRNFDKLEDIYTDQAHHFRNEEQLRKRLYAQIIAQEQEKVQEKVKLKKQLQRVQNKEIDTFWKNQEQRLRAIERKRRQDIDQARRVNNQQFGQVMHKSMTVDPYYLQKSYRNDLSEFQQHERRKKQQRERFFKEGMMLEEARRLRMMSDRQREHQTEIAKLQQTRQLEAKRAEYFSNWRHKHFQQKHPQTQKLAEQINHKKEHEESQLQELIAVKGGAELNQRVAAMRLAQIQEQAAKKDRHIKELKTQLQENTYKAAIDKYLQQNYQRTRMDEVSKAMNNRDDAERDRKKMFNNQHLSVLRGQMRPRSLLPEPDKIQVAGIGSPAHIGKIVHEDRIKQLKWIQRSFLQQLKQV